MSDVNTVLFQYVRGVNAIVASAPLEYALQDLPSPGFVCKLCMVLNYGVFCCMGGYSQTVHIVLYTILIVLLLR